MNHDAQALRHKLSGWHGHHRPHIAGIRSAELQRIRTIDVRFANDTDDHDDIGNQRPISGSYGLLTDRGERRGRLRGLAARGATRRRVTGRSTAVPIWWLPDEGYSDSYRWLAERFSVKRLTSRRLGGIRQG